VQNLHATGEAETFLCNQETVDSSKSGQLAQNIQTNG
jgi:hypothetical protein